MTSTLMTSPRRERTAAVVGPVASNVAGAKQMLMGYRGGRYAAVAPGFEFKPGFVYAQVRAIAARINQNWDGWPSDELKKSYRTFIGKPCFVNHQNFDPKKARGKVVAARYREAGDDKYVETVMEIDAQRFPKLAKEIIEGGLDSVSMGVEAGFTICSYCGNKAVDVPEFCEHVKYHKGQKLGRINRKTGAVEPVLVYEKCYKLGFFELSFVFDPADETAVVGRVIAANMRRTGVGVHFVTTPSGKYQLHKPGCPALSRHKGAEQNEAHEYPDLKSVIADVYPPHQFEYDPDNPADLKYYKGDFAVHNCLKAELPHDAGPYQRRQAARRYAQDEQQGMPNMVPVEMPTEEPPTGMMPTAAIEARIDHLANDPTSGYRKRAYGEVEAPARVDTLRPEDDKEGADFKRWVSKSPKDKDQQQPFQNPTDSPPELQAPDLDANRRGESQGGVPMSARRNARRGQRRYAQDPMAQDPMAAMMGGGGGAPPPGGDPSMGMGGGDPSMGGGAPPQSEEELIAQAVQELQMAEQAEGGGGDELPPEEGGDEGLPPEEGEEDLGDEGEEDFGDEGDEEELPPEEGDEGLPPEEGDEEGGEDLPPWLQGGGEEDQGPPPPPPGQMQARRNGNRGGSTQKKRRTTAKGAPQMTLAQRTRVAATQRPRHHYADDGHFDGGPYGEDNQGEQEEVFLSQTPGTEGVSAPTPGDGTISNTENNLVARIQRRSHELRRDMIAYEQITGRRLRGGPEDAYGPPGGGLEEGSLPPDLGQQVGPPPGSPTGMTARRRRYADSVAPITEVNPTVNTGSEGEALTGDSFESLGEEPSETQPKDASRHAFRAFDQWLYNATGRTAQQHGNANFIRRSAARFCSAKGWDPAIMFPALGTVLREARRSEGRNMRRFADEKLDVAAPQDRIDVEAPVSDTTSADAQASQFDLGDFGGNASDNLADPDLSVDSQIWAPGEGDTSFKNSSNRRADGISAVRYAEAYIAAGLAPNTSEEKWKIAGLAQTMRLGTIRDRTALLDAVNQVRAASTRRRTAGTNRGNGGSSIPPGFGQRQLTAGTGYVAANDYTNDSAMFLK